ncbi:HopJ type III effector protein [Tamlana sp. 2_MG-2023]|uniref:HopJ type III effector protein n=1 Tax=unclassified Tamlana TaxID=2614803 RepID=UPI0026E1DF75|nr:MULTISPECIES: HopJ type III effector protein [unclassified Tamlana]MDO6759625.1 HopJ type III effector protein [Tamlana sp. 2_MG-2023]MDO6791248.1 HopJ type III effector protein [Tamlana sp. 1_MG-2023]
MNIETFKNKLQSKPKSIAFSETMSTIEAHYKFTPTAFINGALKNGAGENSGSCKLFAFAKKQGFTKEETLACFGRFYFEDVLEDPNGSGHQNIRNFMKTGFEGLVFEGEALLEK